MPPRHRPRSGRGRTTRLLAVGLSLVVGSTVGLVRAWVARDTGDPVHLRYSVRVVDAPAGRLDVTLTLDGANQHVVLGYSGHAVEPTAPSSKFRVRTAGTDGEEFPIEAGTGTWTVRPDAGPLRVDYEVHLNRGRGDRGSYTQEALSQIDVDGARLLGSDLFLFPLDVEIGSIDVDYELPPGWTFHHPYADGPTSARIPSLRALYSSAVAVGRYRHAVRRVDGVEFEVALRGRYAFDDEDLVDVVERIVRHQVDFFGGATHARYLFVVNEHPRHDDPDLLHYFGLHFQASMVVLIDPRTDRRRLHGEPASLCAHEFFHNWLGERVRQEEYAMNWFVEGVTTLYAYRTRLATGMLDAGTYARDVETRYREQWLDVDLRHTMTLAEAGRMVLQDPAVTRMTYTGGLLAGIALDARIATLTGGRESLDGVLRDLVERATADPEFRLTRDTLEQVLVERTGEDFGPWLDRTVYGHEDLSLPAYVTSR